MNKAYFHQVGSGKPMLLLSEDDGIINVLYQTVTKCSRGCKSETKQSARQHTTWQVNIRVRVSEFFLIIFLMGETEAYFGLLTG